MSLSGVAFVTTGLLFGSYILSVSVAILSLVVVEGRQLVLMLFVACVLVEDFFGDKILLST